MVNNDITLCLVDLVSCSCRVLTRSASLCSFRRFSFPSVPSLSWQLIASLFSVCVRFRWYYSQVDQKTQNTSQEKFQKLNQIETHARTFLVTVEEQVAGGHARHRRVSLASVSQISFLSALSLDMFCPEPVLVKMMIGF